jgi:hypothetical protein
LGLRQLARSCSIGLGTVHEYLQRAEAVGVTWPLGEDWDEERLEAALFGGPPRVRPAALPMSDFAELHQQRQLHPHLTQQLFWEKYRQSNPDGYRYSGFCELFERWRRKQDVVLRLASAAGAELSAPYRSPCFTNSCSAVRESPPMDWPAVFNKRACLLCALATAASGAYPSGSGIQVSRILASVHQRKQSLLRSRHRQYRLPDLLDTGG